MEAAFVVSGVNLLLLDSLAALGRGVFFDSAFGLQAWIHRALFQASPGALVTSAPLALRGPADEAGTSIGHAYLSKEGNVLRPLALLRGKEGNVLRLLSRVDAATEVL